MNEVLLSYDGSCATVGNEAKRALLFYCMNEHDKLLTQLTIGSVESTHPYPKLLMMYVKVSDGAFRLMEGAQGAE